jgi:hypothetical protein
MYHDSNLTTMTSPYTAIARVAAWPVWVHVVLTSLRRIVIPRQEILEYGARVIKILRNDQPRTVCKNWHPPQRNE